MAECNSTANSTFHLNPVDSLEVKLGKPHINHDSDEAVIVVQETLRQLKNMARSQLNALLTYLLSALLGV